MNIGAAAAASGVNAKMIRHYEAIGLLRPAERRSNAYRDYGERDLHEFKFIRRARRLGFSIRGNRRIAGVVARPRPAEPRGEAHRRNAYRRSPARMAEMQAMANTLRELVSACHGDDRPDCPILDDLAALMTLRHWPPAQFRSSGPCHFMQGSSGEEFMRPIDRTVLVRRKPPEQGRVARRYHQDRGSFEIRVGARLLAATGHTVLAYARAPERGGQIAAKRRAVHSRCRPVGRLRVARSLLARLSRPLRAHACRGAPWASSLSLTEAIDMSRDPHTPRAFPTLRRPQSLQVAAFNRRSRRNRREFQPYGKASASISEPFLARFRARRTASATTKTAAHSTISALRCGQSMRLKSLSRSKSRPTATRSFIMTVTSPTSTRS